MSSCILSFKKNTGYRMIFYKQDIQDKQDIQCATLQVHSQLQQITIWEELFFYVETFIFIQRTLYRISNVHLNWFTKVCTVSATWTRTSCNVQANQHYKACFYSCSCTTPLFTQIDQLKLVSKEQQVLNAKQVVIYIFYFAQRKQQVIINAIWLHQLNLDSNKLNRNITLNRAWLRSSLLSSLNFLRTILQKSGK